MVNLSVARRYARALLDVAAEAGKLDVVSDQLSAFARAMQQSKELNDLLLNPAYTRPQRSGVVESLLTSSKMDPVVGNLLRLLVERNRLGFLPDIARIFSDLVDQRVGRVRGRVTSAVKLAPEALQKLTRQLEAATQRKVTLEERVDPALLGGLSAQVGSVVYDGSLRSQLDELRRTLQAR